MKLYVIVSPASAIPSLSASLNTAVLSSANEANGGSSITVLSPGVTVNGLSESTVTGLLSGSVPVAVALLVT
ncbi:hypothetical protein D3C84_1121970 [compost metagenome]